MGKSCEQWLLKLMTAFKKRMTKNNYVITELLWSFICFGHRDKSCSDHFVLNGHPLLRYPMKLVPLATLVHMDVKAFPSRPSVPLLITNSIVY
ncbi:conserved hypothetical protein, partial [Trichinella spiralis]|uniref:hypothetical protein n=1 Tax=Trichinella spiralis TaxID=6334 RepID=UPI0001EFEDDF